MLDLKHYTKFNEEYPELSEYISKLISNIKINKAFSKYLPLQVEDYNNLKQALEILEFDAINYWETQNEKNKFIFIEICSTYLDIALNVLPPINDKEKIDFTIKIICFGYLGEKWETVRKFIIANEETFLVSSEEDNWKNRLYKNIYLSIFYLIRKKDWKDLTKVTEHINQLRVDQLEFEKKYISELESTNKNIKVLELVSYYHLAKAVELTAEFQLYGQPNDIVDQVKFHLEYAIRYTEVSANIEFNLNLRYLQSTLLKMISNSIWMVAKAVNSRVTKFVELITKSNKPIFELLYPQKEAILEKGLLDPANKAVVVNLPTSSGKTMIAEFRILQTLNQFSDDNGWIVYLVPTRALVNQITIKLRNDLSRAPLNIKVEQISGALEKDAFEEALLSKDTQFHILVTTYEKFNLLMRQGIEKELERPLALVIVDEAQNIATDDRGMSLEVLLSIIKKESNAHFLLLTPFIPNSEEVALWLDPNNSKSISIELNWKPNEHIIGKCYLEGTRRDVKCFFKPIVTSRESIVNDEQILVKQYPNFNKPISQVKSNKSSIATIVSQAMNNENGTLIIGGTIPNVFTIADELYTLISDSITLDDDTKLLQKYIAAELGNNFPLVKYLNKGIGIHHAALPDDIRLLIELLMEKGAIKYLVSTTTIAQGINFPISSLFLATYSYPYGQEMPSKDFWNLVGRVGRIYQNDIGVVGLAVKNDNIEDNLKLSHFLSKKTENLISVLVKMVEDAINLGDDFKLSKWFNRPEWSSFLQYIAHMYKQSNDLNSFITDVELMMRRTYGYNQLSVEKKRFLVDEVKKYAHTLNKGLASLSDSTGFSPETIKITVAKLREQDFAQSDWSNNLLSGKTQTLKKLVGIMLSAPEINDQLRDIVTGSSPSRSNISKIIVDWVQGKDLVSISKKYFGGNDPTAISNCVRSIFGRLINSASWGLSALQKMSGIEIDKLPINEKNELLNLPAKIYYGVNSNEGVILRKQNVPRIIADKLGKQFTQDFNNEIYGKSSTEVMTWLSQLSVANWNKVAPKKKHVTGSEYKQIWERLNGLSA